MNLSLNPAALEIPGGGGAPPQYLTLQFGADSHNAHSQSLRVVEHILLRENTPGI
jgi:hypothetical protein